MKLDAPQVVVKNKLDQLSEDLESRQSDGFLKKLFNKKPLPKGFYIHGGVGRGKTMLMRNFFDSLKETPKFYVHFNSFMRSIHEALRDIRNENLNFDDELIEAIRRVVTFGKKDYKAALICFDEFQVVDIADAMLLSRIFTHLFNLGVVAVFTSNTQPLDLYKDGLQREVFLEFVRAVLLKNVDVLYLDSPNDYRALRKAKLSKRYLVSNRKNRLKFQEMIDEFIEGRALKAKKIKVWGREVELKKTYKKILVVSYEELCCQPLSASDYQEICKNFDLIFFKGLPRLNENDRNEMRRLMLFIDEVYERKIGLIILAKTAIKNISSDHVFKRTASRLREIKSDYYWLNRVG